MNTLQKEFQKEIEKNPYYQDNAHELVVITVEETENTKITLELYLPDGFEESSDTFGATWEKVWYGNMPGDWNWEEVDPEITFASLTKQQQQKAKEIWKNL